MTPVRLGPADAETVAARVRAAFAGLELDPPPSAARLTAEEVLAHFAAGGGGAAIGDAASVLWDTRDGGLYVSRLAVAASERGRGHATRLMQAAESEARSLGLPRLWLSVRLVLAGNRRLFAGLGYTETIRHAHPGYPYFTFVDMEKRVLQ